MKTYLVIDEFILSRESLCSLVNETINNCIVYRAKTIDEAKYIIEHQGQVDFFIFNPACAQNCSNEILKQLRNLSLQAKILFISSYRHNHHTRRLMEKGADATIDIHCTKDEICTAIQSLDINQTCKNQSSSNYMEVQSDVRLTNAVFQISKSNKASCNINLTKRQREVFDYITKGYANKFVANELGVSESTVKLHVLSILRALKVTNNTETLSHTGLPLQSVAH